MEDKTIKKGFEEQGRSEKEVLSATEKVFMVSGLRDEVSHSALQNSVEVPMDAY